MIQQDHHSPQEEDGDKSNVIGSAGQLMRIRSSVAAVVEGGSGRGKLIFLQSLLFYFIFFCQSIINEYK